MVPDIYLDLPSPFGLPRPTRAWCDVIASFDPDLRIFPSQTHSVYRLMRRAHQTPVGALVNRVRAAIERGILTEVNPDTRIAIQHRLVAVSTLPKEITTVSPERIVASLQRRDQWGFRDGDAVADALDQRDADEVSAIDRERNRQYRERRKAAGISLLYRTGARVSLIKPSLSPTPGFEADCMGTPDGDSAVTVSPKE
ncbi:MAG TPA: hypothetical protein VM118_11665 [Acidobacteriota bacterium]|nr:hypothetical protein [Acidobacteriota bacterium]